MEDRGEAWPEDSGQEGQVKYKAVFFDFDGTLMDTSIGIFAGGRYAMEKLGLPIDEEHTVWRSFIGPPIGDCFRITFGVKDDALVDELVKQYRVYYEAEGRFKAVFYPGIVDVLRALKARGYKLAVASMKNEDLVVEMCEHFGIADLFDEMLGLDLAGEATKESLLRKGFERLGLEPCECVLVGDTQIDSDGAKAAGCDCIKVDWGFGFTKGQTGTIGSAQRILDLV